MQNRGGVAHPDNIGITLDRGLTDILKFVSCILIALHHYSSSQINNGEEVNIIMRCISTQGGYFGVALFFFFAGYGIMKSEKAKGQKYPNTGIKISFIRRLKKILIPTIIISLIWLPIYWLYFRDEDLSVMSIIYSLGDDTMWFIRTLIVQYVLLYVYIFLSDMYSKYKIPLFIVASVISFSISYFVNIRHAISLPLFWMGVGIVEFPKFFSQMISSKGVIIILAIIITSILMRGNMMFIHASFNYIAVLSMMMFLAHFNFKINLLSQYVYEHTFGIYLVHNKILIMLREIFDGIVPLWLFIGSVAIGANLFNIVRKRMFRFLTIKKLYS